MVDEAAQDEEEGSDEEEEEGDKKKERQPQPRPIIVNMPKKGMNSAQQSVLAAFGVTMIALAVRHGTVAKLREWAKKPVSGNPAVAPDAGNSSSASSPKPASGPVANSNLPGQGPNSNVA